MQKRYPGRRNSRGVVFVAASRNGVCGAYSRTVRHLLLAEATELLCTKGGAHSYSQLDSLEQHDQRTC